MKTILGGQEHKNPRAQTNVATRFIAPTRGFPDKKGAVLIIALWILSMLVLLAISIGRRTSIELRLLKYHLSRSQAFHLARAAIERIYAEKNTDDNKYDSLNEAWSNKLKAEEEPLFKDFPLGNGTFTIKYNRADADYYGMRDESSKLNINNILKDSKVDDNRKKEFKQLIANVLGNSDKEAEEMTDNFTDWIDNIDDSQEIFSNGEIQAKNAPLDRLEELTMLDGFSIEDIFKLSDYITIYTDGSININTASREALIALGFSESEADDTVKLRNGDDDKAATNDDTIFLTTEEFVNTKILENNNAKDAIKNRLSAASLFYRVNSSAEVNGVKKELSAVIHFTKDAAPKYLYWHED